jgi:hypothetical protein
VEELESMNGWLVQGSAHVIEMQMKLLLLYYCWSGNLVDLLGAMRGTGQGRRKGGARRLTGCCMHNAMRCYAMRDGGTCTVL